MGPIDRSVQLADTNNNAFCEVFQTVGKISVKLLYGDKEQ